MRAALALVFLSLPSFAQQPFVESGKITWGGAPSNSGWGWSAAHSGDALAVGFRNKLGPNGTGLGAVFVRSGAQWNFQAWLDGYDTRRFGHATAFVGDVIAMSDPEALFYGGGSPGGLRGAVWFFRRQGTSWPELGFVHASDYLNGDQFGDCIAMDAQRLVVGAPKSHENAGSPGAAYVYLRGTPPWLEQAKLSASDASAGDDFGAAVAVSDAFIVVGAPQRAGASGGAYVFARNGSVWSEMAILAPAGLVGAAQFGRSVAFVDDWILVGAPHDGLAGANNGSVRVFELSGGSWLERAPLVAPDATPTSALEFGATLSSDGGRVAVGAPSDDGIVGPDEGSAYLFARDGVSWSRATKIRPRDPSPSDAFGTWLFLSGNALSAGLPQDDEPGAPESGSVRFFDLFAETGKEFCAGTDADCPCGMGSALLNGCPNHDEAQGAALVALGAASVTHDSLTLRAGGVTGSAACVFVQSSAMSPVGPVAWGDGIRCLAEPLVRLSSRNAFGGVALDPRAGELPLSVRGSIPAAGGTRYYQVVYRNASAFCTPEIFNTTNAAAVSWRP